MKDILTDPIDRAMVNMINEIGHVMGLMTIAEYVEDAATLELLRGYGVDYAQGNYLGKPREALMNITRLPSARLQSIGQVD